MIFPYLFIASLIKVSYGGNFYQDIEITWGDQRAQIIDGGQLLTLSLDKFSGSGFQSKNEYLFGRIDMQLKVVPGNSAGSVTTYTYLASRYVAKNIYHIPVTMQLSSQGALHDEIDFEFLGNLSGDPYIVHTNIFTQGKVNREQQFYVWFDPTIAFHTYSIVWKPRRIIFMVENIPLRVFDKNEAIGVPFPNSQAMRVYSSIWNADNWATQGGRVKTDCTKDHLTASYKNFNANACACMCKSMDGMCKKLGKRKLFCQKDGLSMTNIVENFSRNNLQKHLSIHASSRPQQIISRTRFEECEIQTLSIFPCNPRRDIVPVNRPVAPANISVAPAMTSVDFGVIGIVAM
ncbi:hypothetical protein HYC85_015103 [Camellia sinensis]|uniref:GH16 domain-containing protein n=1 Tax=Camellia sinensis TaxID=4442 RepID=A0A7J7HBJ3_CAMSI|nr:hypothetical protein HYC85_015103 [Camellia sinensis]